MLIKSIILLSSIVFLSGCGTTIKDFQKMTPDQRAGKTCINSYDVKKHSNRITEYNKKLTSYKRALLKGYKIVEQCSTTTIRNTRYDDYKYNDYRYNDYKYEDQYRPRGKEIKYTFNINNNFKKQKEVIYHPEYKKQKNREYRPKNKVIKTCKNEIIPYTDYALNQFQSEINRLEPLLYKAVDNESNSYDSCYSDVVRLSPEKAFLLFKK